MICFKFSSLFYRQSMIKIILCNIYQLMQRLWSGLFKLIKKIYCWVANGLINFIISSKSLWFYWYHFFPLFFKWKSFKYIFLKYLYYILLFITLHNNIIIKTNFVPHNLDSIIPSHCVSLIVSLSNKYISEYIKISKICDC